MMPLDTRHLWAVYEKRNDRSNQDYDERMSKLDRKGYKWQTLEWEWENVRILRLRKLATRA